MESYKKKYEELEFLIKNLYPTMSDYQKENVEGIFPELCDSKGEKIRKYLLKLAYRCPEDSIDFMNEVKKEDVISWLEKQKEYSGLIKDEKESQVKIVSPKFKEGDWIVQGCNILKIRCVGNKYYCFETVGGYTGDMLVSEIDSLYHLWTIEDANDGDVLSSGEMIVIFKHFEEPSYKQHIVAYIGLDISGNIQITDDTWSLGIDKAKPASKEQRDLLLQKMKEAGYEWDAEKKELKKIEQKPTKWSEHQHKLLNYAISITDDTEVKCFLESLRNKGQQDTLKDLPKWKKATENMEFDKHVLLFEDEERVVLTTEIYKGEYYIETDDLKKLPKEE